LRALHLAHRAGQSGGPGVEPGLAQEAAARLVAEEIGAEGGETAVHHDHLAGDEARLVAGQEQGRVRDVLGEAQVRPRLLLAREAVPRVLPTAIASGVLIMPGAIAFTRMRCAASSAETERLRLATAALAA